MRKLWTPQELAQHLGVPKSWIYDRTCNNGPETIPHIKLGKYVRFDPESTPFRRWLNGHEVGSTFGSTTQQRLQAVEVEEEKTRREQLVTKSD